MMHDKAHDMVAFTLKLIGHARADLYNHVSSEQKLIITNHFQGRLSDRVRKKIENYAEVFGIIMRNEVTIMPNRRQITRKFLTIIKLFPWLFSMYKIHGNVLLRVSVLYDMFDL